MENIQDLDALIAHLTNIRQEAGMNLGLNISVTQDHEFKHFYEDRPLCAHMEVVRAPNSKPFLELYV